MRALFVSAGNPVLSVPNGEELQQAMAGLELAVGIDLYVNETTAHCYYVLPATTMYERDDFPLPFQLLQPTPFRQATEAVVAPAGQARDEWAIIDELSRRLADRTPALRALQITRQWVVRTWPMNDHSSRRHSSIRSRSIFSGVVSLVSPSRGATRRTCVSTTNPSFFP